jgi:ATP-dependent RNA helicase DDX3X
MTPLKKIYWKVLSNLLFPFLAISPFVTCEVKKAPFTRVAYLTPRRHFNCHVTSKLSDISFSEMDSSSLISNGGINFDAYEEIPVETSGREVPPPVSSFCEIDLGSCLQLNIKHCGYKKPTPVQKQAIPIIMAGRDLMASAQTGSGKTAAFCLPIIAGILRDQSGFSERQAPHGIRSKAASPVALIICPTRELAGQV